MKAGLLVLILEVLKMKIVLDEFPVFYIIKDNNPVYDHNLPFSKEDMDKYIKVQEAFEKMQYEIKRAILNESN